MHAGTSHSSKQLRPGILEPHAATRGAERCSAAPVLTTRVREVGVRHADALCDTIPMLPRCGTMVTWVSGRCRRVASP